MKNNLLEKYDKLIWYVANKFYGVDKYDLYQTGVKALIEAEKRFQSDKGAKFSSYAYSYIYGEMYKLANNHMLKVSRDLLKLKNAIEKTRDLLTQKNGEIPTLAEISKVLGYSPEEIKMAIDCLNPVCSMDDESLETRNLYEVVPDANGLDIDNKILVEESLNTLNPMEQEIIKKRYYEDLTQSETAEKLGISQVKVSRYETRSLVKMRDFINL